MSILQTVKAWLGRVKAATMWERIRDDQILSRISYPQRHVWKKAFNDDCKECPETVVVSSPDWYEDNGTPICGCGEDMVYSHTEILKRVEAATRSQKPEVRGQEMWETIQDNLIRHVWKRAEDDDCDEDDGFISPRWLETFISPGWYEKNGTPICDNCERDMEYSHTMIWCTNKPEVRGNEMWETIQDDQVRHVWEKADDDDCEEDPGTVIIPPGWYEDNGTPICDCGQDMVYSHTEIWCGDEAATKRHCENCRFDVNNFAKFLWNSGVRYHPHLRVPCHKCDNTAHWREIGKGEA